MEKFNAAACNAGDWPRPDVDIRWGTVDAGATAANAQKARNVPKLAAEKRLGKPLRHRTTAAR